MKKFEHTFIDIFPTNGDIDNDLHQNTLNKFSENGWEISNVVPLPDTIKLRIYWKREIKQYNIPNTGPR